MTRRSRSQHVAKLPRTPVCGAALRAVSRGARVDAVDAGLGLRGCGKSMVLEPRPRVRHSNYTSHIYRAPVVRVK